MSNSRKTSKPILLEEMLIFFKGLLRNIATTSQNPKDIHSQKKDLEAVITYLKYLKKNNTIIPNNSVEMEKIADMIEFFFRRYPNQMIPANLTVLIAFTTAIQFEASLLAASRNTPYNKQPEQPRSKTKT